MLGAIVVIAVVLFVPVFMLYVFGLIQYIWMIPEHEKARYRELKQAREQRNKVFRSIITKAKRSKS